jgi:hypothetical protein
VFTEHGAKEPESLYEGQRTIPYFRFSDEAQLFFHEWIKNLQEKLEGNSASLQIPQPHALLSAYLSHYSPC